MGCANKANIEFQTWPYGKHKVEYEKGLVLMKDDIIKIMLQFERKSLARFFLTDTHETIQIYILSKKYKIEGETILLNKPKVFFVRVQMHASYGYIDDNSITINKNKDKIIFSGKLGSNKIMKGDGIFANVIFTCKNLKLQAVSSKSEIQSYDPYFKNILDENFPEFYSE